MGSLSKAAPLSKIAQQLEVLKALAKVAESIEHSRLSEQLNEWFKNKFGQGIALQPLPNLFDVEPDVLLWDSSQKMLYIGDAKNAENETSSNKETVKRIKNYFERFASLCDVSNPTKIAGGILAIATNDRQAALDWVPVLNSLAVEAKLKTEDRSPPRFQVELHDGNAWIIWW